MADTYSGIHDLTEISSIGSDDELEVAQKNGNDYVGKKIKAGSLRFVPATTSLDAGKFLIVDSQGVPTFTTISAWTGGNY